DAAPCRTDPCSLHDALPIFEWQLANWCANRSDPTLATQPLGQVVGDALGNVFSWRERIDTFALDDPAPFVAECWDLTRRFVSRADRKSTRLNSSHQITSYAG